MFFFKIAEVTKTKPEELITGPATKEVKTGWDAELRIYGLEDRKSGYDDPGCEWLRCRAAQKAGDTHRKGGCILCTCH